MGFAYLGIGIGGATVPWMSHVLVQHFGWQTALRILGFSIVGCRASSGIPVERIASAQRPSIGPSADQPEGCIPASFIFLSAHPGEHVLHCGGQRHPAEPEIAVES